MIMKDARKARIRPSLGLARVALVLVATAALIFFLSLRATAARADDAMMQLGKHLVALSEAGLGREQRGVSLNGQTLGFRVFTVEHEMSTALDFYENWCHGRAGSFAEQEQRLQLLDESSALPPASLSRSWKDLVIRSEDGDTGYVACLKHGTAGASADELVDRMKSFLATGNLRDLGQFHYAAVTQFEEATRVVALWTEEDFYPMSMFPEEGDAPGFDPIAFTRPSGGRRMLSAGEFGNDETLSIFIDCAQDAATLASFYRRDFVNHGWRLLSDDESEDGSLLIAQRGSEMRALSISQEPGELASVTVATTR
jgi:hypothetical protein